MDGMGWDLCVGLLYEHCFAVLIICTLLGDRRKDKKDRRKDKEDGRKDRKIDESIRRMDECLVFQR